MQRDTRILCAQHARGFLSALLHPGYYGAQPPLVGWVGEPPVGPSLQHHGRQRHLPWSRFPMKCLLTILLLNMLMMVHASAADDVLARIRERDRLIVSVKNEGKPERAAHKDPAHFNKREFELDLAHAIAAMLRGAPEKVEFALMRKPDRMTAVADGRVDIAISMLRPGEGQRARVEYSRP